MQQTEQIPRRTTLVENILEKLGSEPGRGQDELLSNDLTMVLEALEIESEKIYKPSKMRALKKAGIVRTNQFYNQGYQRFGCEELYQIDRALAESI